jgi:hypothetical protein
VSYKPFQTAKQLRELIENDLASVLTESFAQARSREPAETVERRRDNLPVQRISLVDRASETAAARDLLLREDGRCELSRLSAGAPRAVSRYCQPQYTYGSGIMRLRLA